MIYLLTMPLVGAFIGITAAIGMAGLLGKIHLGVWMSDILPWVAFILPLGTSGFLAARDYRRRSYDLFVVESDRLELRRKARILVVPFAEIAALTTTPARCILRSTRGAWASLEMGSWLLFEIVPLLRERVLPALADHLRARTKSGETLVYRVSYRCWLQHLLGGGLLVGMGLLLVAWSWKAGVILTTNPMFAFMAIGVLAAGGKMLQLFFRSITHTVWIDASGIRAAQWFRESTAPWDRLAGCTEDDRGLQLLVTSGRPVRIEDQVDGYPALAELVKRALRNTDTN